MKYRTKKLDAKKTRCKNIKAISIYCLWMLKKTDLETIGLTRVPSTKRWGK